jgi:hypothetical protein
MNKEVGKEDALMMFTLSVATATQMSIDLFATLSPALSSQKAAHATIMLCCEHRRNTKTNISSLTLSKTET